MKVADYDYELPERAIAQAPAEPRDSSRLLVTSRLEDRHFSDLPDLLDEGDLLVVNRTRVRAARLPAVKLPTGGRLEVLLTKHLAGDDWEALVRPARRVRPGVTFEVGPITGHVRSGPEGGVVVVSLDAGGDAVEDLLPSIGTVPLPPYFRGVLNDPERYQTIFAKVIGSAAAPTAALHFTPGLVARLVDRGVELTEIDLEVGLDTFQPMSVGDVEDHVMHRERYEIGEEAAAAIASCRAAGGRVVAVGTTVVRSLESSLVEATVAPGSGQTELFVTPGYRFTAPDAVITNFHAAGTTLILMVAAMLGERWREVYRVALERKYRFLSFGDAMFIDELVRGRED